MKLNATTELFYNCPAADWNQALPVGNGRMGGMVFGTPDNELIQLNEDSLWSGNFRERNNSEAFENLEKIRSLVNEEKTTEAEELCSDAFYGTNENQRHYQPLGDLHIWQEAPESSDYSRGLSLSDAVAYTQFTSGGAVLRREVFASFPDQVIVVHFTSDKAGAISFVSAIDGRDDNYDKNEKYDDNTIIFTVSDGIPYACAITARAKGGVCRVRANRIECRGADEAVLIIAAQSAWRTGDYEKKAVGQAKTAARKTVSALLERHKADYKALFDRCALHIAEEELTDITTDKRLEAVKNGGNDNGLAEMYFNFSRYLMISGSREGTLPLNLQGIWNKDMWPAWGCKYTININTQMNYWGAEMQNLSQCHDPLFDHIERMRENGRVTAAKMYHCRGTVCHHNTDIWGDTAPQDKWLPGTLWPMGMAWLCTHIWEHYQFTMDRDFLSEKFDTMLEAAEFFLDFLTPDEKGRLVTNPSVSPENTYYAKNGRTGTLCKGPSMDSQILTNLFSAVIAAADIVEGISEEDRKTVSDIAAALERLPKPEIGKYGQIMEWAEDYDEVEPGHRHISQLYALYPADIITPEKTPELSKAARATLERRLAHGGGHTGWSRAWIINMWARLHDGEKVQENINALLAYSTSINMFDMHPPFQIDGNFGGGAGICEAVIQSCGGMISFLPALPPAWKKGNASGIIARGGFEVSFSWDNGAVTSAEMISKAGERAVIKASAMPEISCSGKKIKAECIDGAYAFDTEKGMTYTLTF